MLRTQATAATVPEDKPHGSRGLAKGRMRAGLKLSLLLATCMVLAAGAAAQWLWSLAGRRRSPPSDPTCAASAKVTRLGPVCMLHYHPILGEEGPEQQLECVYHNGAPSTRKPCRFNTTQLTCTFPAAARLAVAPRAPCSHPWTTQMAIRYHADAWRMQRVPPGTVRKIPITPVPRAYPTMSGTWGPAGPPRQPGPGWRPRVAFLPPTGQRCPPEATSAVELVGWARATGIRRLVLSGDLAMRQLYQRLLTLARAEPVTVDVVGQRFAHYEVCQEAGQEGTLQDALWFSVDTFPASKRADTSAIRARIARAHANLVAHTKPEASSGRQQRLGEEAGAASAGQAGAGSSDADSSIDSEAGAAGGADNEEGSKPRAGVLGCGSERELVADLVMGTLRQHQREHLRAYVKDVLGGELGSPGGGSGSRELRDGTAFVLAACYWHTSPEDAALWPDYARLLWELRDHARHVVVMTCPIVPGMKPEHTQVLASRNMEIEKLVARDTSGVLRLLDAAQLIAGVPEGATIAEHYYHYACSLISSGDGKAGPVHYPGHDGVVPQFYDALRATQDGTCEDAVNYSLWQALLCLLGAGQNPLDR